VPYGASLTPVLPSIQHTEPAQNRQQCVLQQFQAIPRYGAARWIHIGSPQAGRRIAAIVSVIESCRRLRVPVRDYLAAILPGLADMRIQRVAGLTPAAWAAKTHA